MPLPPARSWAVPSWTRESCWQRPQKTSIRSSPAQRDRQQDTEERGDVLGRVICLRLEREPVRSSGNHDRVHGRGSRSKASISEASTSNQSNIDFVPTASRRQIDGTAARGSTSSNASGGPRVKLEEPASVLIKRGKCFKSQPTSSTALIGKGKVSLTTLRTAKRLKPSQVP